MMVMAAFPYQFLRAAGRAKSQLFIYIDGLIQLD